MLKILTILLLATFIMQAQNRYEIESEFCYLLITEKLIKQQVGIKEIGRNRGARVDDYNKSVNNPLGSPYCAAGLYYCYELASKELGVKNPLTKSGLARNHYNYAKRFGLKTQYKAQRFDLIVWGYTNSIFGHIEQIIEVGEAGWVTTVGFNTSSGNSRDGDGVYFRRRHINNPLQRMIIIGLAGFNYAK